MRIALRFAVAAMLLGFPVFLSAVMIADAASTTLSCPNLTRSLKRGSSGDDVKRLQQYLAQDPTVYPEGQVVGNYGPLTEAAVKRWQAKYGIVSSGDPATTGWGAIGPRTITEIVRQCVAAPGVAAVAAPSTGGLLSVTPITGGTPLTVTIQAIVNTANVCGGATYDLDYGDGSLKSQIAVPAGTCSQMTKSFSHTYRNKGTYQISLAAGAHRTYVAATAY